jgi:large subunit ribosomal protein L29
MARAARNQELRALADSELETKLTETKQELFNLRFQHVTGQLDNYSRLGDLKREIARVTTMLREREIEAAEALEASEAASGANKESANG